MELNTIKLSLGSLLLTFLIFGCADHKKSTEETKHKPIQDTCGAWYSAVGNDIRDAKGNEIESAIGCRSCHSPRDTRDFRNLLTMHEISAIDSSKLDDFIFTTKHNDLFKKIPDAQFRIKKIDSLSECDRKNLLHFLKGYSRPIKHILKRPVDTTNVNNK
jgi:hypothetical protein